MEAFDDSIDILEEEMPEDVAKRLEELRVNVKEITYEPADEK